MNTKYIITGMTCGGCKASIEKALQTIEMVNAVSVNLETSEATISSNQEISLETLKNTIPNKFTISKHTTQNSLKQQSTSTIKQLFPLFLIVSYILGAAILLNIKLWNTASFMLDFMGLFYIVFSFFKFLDLKGFSKSFPMYDPLAKKVSFYAWLYPFIELALGILLLMRLQVSFALVFTIVILSITTIGVVKTLLNKKTIQCACLGTVLKLPMTKATFIENSIMLAMATIMLIKLNV